MIGADTTSGLSCLQPSGSRLGKRPFVTEWMSAKYVYCRGGAMCAADAALGVMGVGDDAGS